MYSLFMANILILSVFCSKAQVNETFFDRNLTNNPLWVGDTASFTVNAVGELQLKASSDTKKVQIATVSMCDMGAVWKIDLRMETNPSNYNNVKFYILSVSEDLINSPNAYYVVIGNNADEVSLYSQSAASKSKMIDGADKRLDRDIVDVKVKILLSKGGEFVLYSKLADEADFIEEGRAKIKKTYQPTQYLGIVVTYSSKNVDKYFFRSIRCICPEEDPVDPVDPAVPENSFDKHPATQIDGNFFVESDVYFQSTGDFYVLYAFSQPGLVANITSFDVAGNVIEYVANNVTLLNRNGKFKLSGNYPSGIVVILAEVYTINGKVKRWKIPIVCGK